MPAGQINLDNLIAGPQTQKVENHCFRQHGRSLKVPMLKLWHVQTLAADLQTGIDVEFIRFYAPSNFKLYVFSFFQLDRG